jgi:hypothetical protein
MQSNEYKLLVVLIATIGVIATFGTSIIIVNAQPLERDPIPAFPVVDNVTGEAEPIQMTIDASEFLPGNGTMTLSMAGMNDIDFKDTPPAGITVIVSNDSATVTNQPVQLPGAAPGSGNTVPTPASSTEGTDESSDGGD